MSGNTFASGDSHICVCIPTYKRPEMLRRLLTRLQRQQTNQLFSYSVLVVDNDREESSGPVVSQICKEGFIRVRYVVAPEKNVAVARNVAVQNAVGDLIAFVDDDEVPVEDWLLNLFEVYRSHNVDGVLGPVKPVFEQTPPKWILRAKLFDRPSYKTGTRLDWQMTRTGNLLIRKQIFDDPANLFNPAFRHSEDQDFFKRMVETGFVFVWCDEAPVYETEPAERFKVRYLLRRALVRGNAAMRHRRFSKVAIIKSLIAVVVYTSVLPLLALIGQHLFMSYLIKLCDHIGALMAVARVDLVNYFGGA